MDIQILKLFPGGLIPCGTQTIFYLGDTLIMDPFSLGYCSLYMQTIFRKYPFKGTGKFSKLFDMILWSHEQAAWYHTPLNRFLQDIRPRGTTFEFKYLCEFETDFEKGMT
jgi:hypothetical protein